MFFSRHTLLTSRQDHRELCGARWKTFPGAPYNVIIVITEEAVFYNILHFIAYYQG